MLGLYGAFEKFSYDINYVCDDKDDCARIFAKKKIFEMTQKF